MTNSFQRSDNSKDSGHQGPLDGIRVLDLTSVVLGPIATQILADYGADVIKIESPEGDLMRSNGVSKNSGMSSIFLTLNRNKRSIVLDLKCSEDQEALRKLIAEADVLVHNMRADAIGRLGFSYDAVAKIKPDIVYCMASGFGQAGSYRARPAFDDIIQASCGLVALSSSDGRDPEFFPSLLADKTAGLTLANAVLGGLFYKQRHGIGQFIEVPMFETLVAFVMAEHMGGACFVPDIAPPGYSRILHGGRRPMKTSDGWICALPYTGRHWQAFFRVCGLEGVGNNFQVNDREQLNANMRELYKVMAEVLPQRSTKEWLELFESIDVPCAPISALAQVFDNPHLKEVGVIQESDHPTEGTIREIRPTTRFSKTPLTIRSHAPSLGEHTEAVLSQFGILRH